MRPYLFSLPDWLPGPIGGHPVFLFGLLLGLCIFVGWGFGQRTSIQIGYPPRIASGAAFAACFVGLIGARITWFATDPNAQFSIAKFFDFASGGMVLYGALVIGITATRIYLHVQGFRFWAIMDCYGPVMPLGIGIARLGCFLYGCDYGIPVSESAPLAIRYPRWDLTNARFIGKNPPALDAHTHALGLSGDATASLPIIPTQLYESFAGFTLFAILLILHRRKTFDGQTTLQFCLFYGLWRFLLEFVRGDIDRGVGLFGTPFSTSQLISLALIALSLAFWKTLAGRGHLLSIRVQPATAGGAPTIGGSAGRKKRKRRRK